MQEFKHFRDDDNYIYASVCINTDTQMLMSLWRGKIACEGKLSAVIHYCCQQIATYKLTNWLTDLTGLDSQFSEMSAQVQKLVFSELSTTPLKRFALISQLPANPARSALLLALQQIKVEVRSFEYFSPAAQWLTLPVIEDATWKVKVQKVY